MPRIERLFSSQPLTGAPGVFDSGGPGFAEGAIQATREIRGASRRAFASQKAALDRQTSALTQRAEAVRVLGNAVSGAGRDLVDIGVELNRREDKARRESVFATARTNLMVAADDAQSEARAGGQPDGSDFEDRFLERYHKAQARELERVADDPDLTRGITMMAGEIRTRGRIDMRTEAAKAKGAHRLAKLEGRIAAVANGAIGLKGLEQQIILQAGFDDIDAQHVVGTIDLGQRNAKKAALRAFVRDGAITVDAGRDPAAAAQRLQAGGYDHLFVNEAEKVTAGRTIQTELSARRAAAEARLDDDIDDHLERIQTTGRGTPGMKAQVKALDGDTARFADLEAQAELYFRTAQQIRWATPEEAKAAVAEQKAAVQVDPEARTPGGFRRREFIQLGAGEAADDRDDRLADDPYAYAAEHPVLGQSRDDVIALQKAMGVKAYSYMSANEAAERVRTYTATPEDGKAELLRQWSVESGKHRQALSRDLAAAQLPASAQFLLRHAENPRMRAVLNRSFAAEDQGYRELTKDLTDDEAAALRREVVTRLFADQADDGGSGSTDRVGADASTVGENIGVGDIGFDDDLNTASDGPLVLAAAGADGEDDSKFVPNEKVAAEVFRRLDLAEFADTFNFERYVESGRFYTRGIGRFFDDFGTPEVSDATFDKAALVVGLDPERARLFRDMLNVDETTFDRVHERLITVFDASPLRTLLKQELHSLLGVDSRAARTRTLKPYFRHLEQDENVRDSVGAVLGIIVGAGAGRGFGRRRSRRLPPRNRPASTPGGNEQGRLAALRQRSKSQPSTFFNQSAENAFRSTNVRSADPDEQIRRGLAAIDVTINDFLSGGVGTTPRAMRVRGLGDVTFIWGRPGKPLKKYREGEGIAHIVAKHGPEVLEGGVVAIVKGTRRLLPGNRVSIQHKGINVILSKVRFEEKETWWLTGYRIGKPEVVDKPFDLSAINGPLFFKQ